MDEDKRISYFCLGLGIGVAVGILFAPKSGEETRQLLKARADESKDFLVRKADESKEFITRKADESKEFISRKSEEVKESTVDLVDRSKLAIQRQKEQLAAAVDAGRQAYRETLASEKAGETAL